jgi:hypothetical protein
MIIITSSSLKLILFNHNINIKGNNNNNRFIYIFKDKKVKYYKKYNNRWFNIVDNIEYLEIN